MKRALLLAAAFAFAAFLLLVIIDALLWGAYQGAEPRELRSNLVALHSFFHAGALVLSFVGAGLGFVILRNRAPRLKSAVVLGLLFGLLSAFAAPGSLMLAGSAGAASWLLLGSLAFAIGGSVLRKPWRGG